MKDLFSNDRYITKGIKEKINPLHYLLLWELIDEMSVEQKDYLQVFNIKVKVGKRRLVEIEHMQENPEYRAVHKFYTDIPIDDVKVFVIDDGDHTTMLLPSEY